MRSNAEPERALVERARACGVLHRIHRERDLLQHQRVCAARCRSTYCKMPPWMTYSTSCGVSLRAVTVNDFAPAWTVSCFFGLTPPAMPAIENDSSPVRPSDAAS